MQASFLVIMRLSASSRLRFLLRTLQSKHVNPAGKDFDDLLEWALASMITGEEASSVGLANPEQVASDVEACKRLSLLGLEALSEARLPIREGGVSLINSADIREAAYVGCQALVLGRVAAVSAREELTTLFQRPSDRPMMAGLTT